MNIKTKYSLGDEVLYDGEPFFVASVSCSNLKKLILAIDTRPKIYLHLYQTSRISFRNEYVSEDSVKPINHITLAEATQAIEKVAIHNLEPDEDDIYMGNLADLSLKVTEIYHLADKAYAEADIRELLQYYESLALQAAQRISQERDPKRRAIALGLYSAYNNTAEKLEEFIIKPGANTLKLREEMRDDHEN